MGPLAASVPDPAGVYVVPAFTGLRSPSSDPYASAALVDRLTSSDSLALRLRVYRSPRVGDARDPRGVGGDVLCPLRGIRVYVLVLRELAYLLFFFFNDPATTEIYTLSLHDALPISDETLLLGPVQQLVAAVAVPGLKQGDAAPVAVRSPAPFADAERGIIDPVRLKPRPPRRAEIGRAHV